MNREVVSYRQLFWALFILVAIAVGLFFFIHEQRLNRLYETEVSSRTSGNNPVCYPNDSSRVSSEIATSTAEGVYVIAYKRPASWYVEENPHYIPSESFNCGVFSGFVEVSGPSDMHGKLEERKDFEPGEETIEVLSINDVSVTKRTVIHEQRSDARYVSYDFYLEDLTVHFSLHVYTYREEDASLLDELAHSVVISFTPHSI